jgi:HEAT repeat protein
MIDRYGATRLKALLFAAIVSAAFGIVRAIGEESVAAADKNRDTLRFGIDDEIMDLLKKLKAEKNYALNEDLAGLFRETTSARMKEAVLSFMQDAQDARLADDARNLLEATDRLDDAVIVAAISYEGTIGDAASLDAIRALLQLNNPKFASPGVKAVGKIGGIANEDFLLDYYEKQAVVSVKQDVIAALGTCGTRKSVEKLIGILDATDSDKGLRYAACEALAKLADAEAVSSLLKAADDASDPILRGYAVAALYPFDAAEARNAILQALRDNYYRVRIAAAKGVAAGKIAGAVPYLEYRIGNDPEISVKAESMKALVAIGEADGLAFLRSFFADAKNNQGLRITAFSLLAHSDTASSFAFLDENLKKEASAKERALYNALFKEMSTVVSPVVEPVVKRMLADGDFVIRSMGLDAVKLNGFSSLRPDLEKMANDPIEAVRKKAKEVLDAL